MKLSSLLITLTVTVCVCASVRAAGPIFWTTISAADLLRGTSDGVYVGLDGVVTPGPQLTNRLGTTPAQVWSLAAAADGTLWAGTGGDSKLLRLRPGQPEETIASVTETGIFAIAVSGTRTYYASSPDGRVYVVDGAATPRVFFDPDEKYIWALAVDSTGALWVGAGTPAAIYRVDASGTGHVLYRPPAAHVVTLAPDGKGNMLAGTESPGRLYRVDASGRPFVLLDSEMTELHAIAVARDGSVFAAAMIKGDDTATTGDATASLAATLPPATPGTPAPAATTTTPPARRSAIYRIDPSGSWETYWETPDVIYDIAVDADGSLIAASGPEGRLYRVGRNQQVQLMTGVDAHQITRLATAGSPASVVAMATANPGRVIGIGTAIQSPATYISPVRDTRGSSTWGTLRWESQGATALFTRSGNTDKPDDSWSDWVGPYTRRDGETVKSPPARYLQWKAVFTRSAGQSAPQLTSVTIGYLPRNSRPVVSGITVYPPGVVFQRPFGDDAAIAGLDDATADARRPPGDTTQAPAPGRRMYQKSLQTIGWKADDGDGDRMTYALAYRREGESSWHDLKSDLGDTIFVWDTTSVADGRYIVRITASDSPSNATDRALTGEHETPPIDVDNTPPVITTEIARQNGIHVMVHARDAQSPIAKLEFSLGGGRWQIAYPVDGVADSPDERYDLPVASETDLARLVVRVTDLLQNTATQPAVIH